MRKESRNCISQRLLCLLLVFAMLLGLCACVDPDVNVEATTTKPQPTTQTTAPTTAPTTVPTTAPTTAPTTVPTTVPKPVKEPLVYVLTQEDVDLYYTLLQDCETLALAGEDMEAIEAASDALDAQYEYLYAQLSVANILYYCDSYSSAMKNQYLDCVDICTEANKEYIEMARRIYKSDSPAKDMLFEGWTDEDFAMLMAFDEKITKLQQRNEEITVEYNAARKDDLKMDLYIEFVKNNNKIAKYYGYDNYYEYAYEMSYNRDYSPETLKQMRQYAKDYLTETFKNATLNFYNTFYSLGNADQTSVTNFLYNDYTQGKNYVKLYLDAMPDNMADVIEYMIDMDSTFTTSKKAKAGAFTTMIGERSYCYFGPGYASANTVLHEGGHYYASRFADLGSIPLDLAETHSQGNEWLFTYFLKDHIPSKQYNALVNYRLYSDLAMIMICLMVDEFEQRVYTTDISKYTPEDFNELMESVATQYFDMTYINDNLTDIQSYWRMVVVDQPIYYISYAVSSIASISLYEIALDDFEKATNIYIKLCEEPVLEEGFLGNIKNAGLYSPFDEQFYKELQALIESRTPNN